MPLLDRPCVYFLYSLSGITARLRLLKLRQFYDRRIVGLFMSNSTCLQINFYIYKNVLRTPGLVKHKKRFSNIELFLL